MPATGASRSIAAGPQIAAAGGEYHQSWSAQSMRCRRSPTSRQSTAVIYAPQIGNGPYGVPQGGRKHKGFLISFQEAHANENTYRRE